MKDTTTNSSLSSKKRPRTGVRPGDIVTIDLDLQAENGFVPEPLFDCHGKITFVVGWGNYLPGLHALVTGKAVGDRVGSNKQLGGDDTAAQDANHDETQEGSNSASAAPTVSLDAGWGSRRKDLIVRVPKEQLQFPDNGKLSSSSLMETIVPGTTTFTLQGGTTVLVTEVTEDSVVLDANPPLAGSSYACSLQVLEIDALPPLLSSTNASSNNSPDIIASASPSFQVATFALGCFWGAELAFMRLEGVVGTKVGYTQGHTAHPTYEQVCTGRTKHREAVLVVYDSRIVSYETLVQTAIWRFREGGKVPPSHMSSTNPTSFVHQEQATNDDDSMFSVLEDIGGLFQEPSDNDDTANQYQHGVYYHSPEQLEIAQQVLARSKENTFELLEAGVFYDAEAYHQQYLYKGGQSAQKGCKTKIRCYG